MNFRELDSYELLRLQQDKADIAYHDNGKESFVRSANHCDFYYQNSKKAAELDLLKPSMALPASYTLCTWYKNGNIQLQATGQQNKIPTWYKLYYHNGQPKYFKSIYIEQNWDIHGNITGCKAVINGKWNNLLHMIKQSTPNASQATLNATIHKLIHSLREKRMLPPYDSEYNFNIRKNRMTNLSMHPGKYR